MRKSKKPHQVLPPTRLMVLWLLIGIAIGLFVFTILNLLAN